MAEIQEMDGDLAHGAFCSLSIHAEEEDEPQECNPEGEYPSLTNMHGGWAGPLRDHGLPGSVARKVASFLQARPAVLHADELINKKDAQQVRYLMQRLIAQRMPIQVIFLQGVIPLQSEDLFPRLLELLAVCPIWSMNLGELRFSDEQCGRLAEALKTSGVTHLFYECTVAGQWKEVFRTAIRANRSKHGFYRLGPDSEQNRVVTSSIKSW